MKNQPYTPLVDVSIKGQVRGGKNNMIVTRSGLHFPRPAFARWRTAAIAQVLAQRPRMGIDCLLDAHIEYTSEDRRRRDAPAIIDALWHVLERSGVVKDDAQIKVVHYHGANCDKAAAGCRIRLYQLETLCQDCHAKEHEAEK